MEISIYNLYAIVQYIMYYALTSKHSITSESRILDTELRKVGNN